MRFRAASRFFACGIVLVLCDATEVLAQKGGSSGGSAPSASSAGRTPNNPQPTQPTNLPSGTNTNNRYPGNTQQSPIFLSGRVVTDDGSPVDSSTRIERVCGISVRLEGHVDSKGRFAFQLGGENSMDVDASSTYSAAGTNGSQSQLDSGGSGSLAGSRGLGGNGMAGCELRATLAGFHSDRLELSDRRSLDNPDVGTIVLHRIGKIEGTTMSVTTLEAPKQAKKQYEKGLQLSQKGKFEEAVQHLTQATTEYPQYAIAWETLGEINAKQGQVDQAKTAFQAAIKADSHFVNPYEQLAFLYAHQQKWQDAADTSQRAISLDPVEFPGSFWCNAVANFNLKKPQDAETSIRALIKLDTQHRFPQAEKMMGELMIDRNKVPEAVFHMRAYLALVPNAPDATDVRQWLGKVDQASAKPVPASPAQ